MTFTGYRQTNTISEEDYPEGLKLNKIPKNLAGWAFPALFQTPVGWIVLTESAPSMNYCGWWLCQHEKSDEFLIGFPEKGEEFPGQANLSEGELPITTPWRTICVGETLKPIFESTLGTDLVEPWRLKETSFIKPGKAA